MKITKQIEIALTEEEQYLIAKDYILKHKDAFRAIMKGNVVNCPFPTECKRFPCDRPSCNADVCDNGFARRMS